MNRPARVMLLLAGLIYGTPGQAATVEQRYASACATCHAGGMAGAPKRGDAAAWAPRLRQGEAALLQHVKNGIRAMPPKGLCNDCTDAEFRALITYMSQ
jgi:cytochrome c5